MTDRNGKDSRPLLWIALAGSLLMWAALPPLALGWLGWIAPVPWLAIVRWEQLPGRRPYGILWLAGFVFWLAAIHWLRLPHPAVYLGWFALSAYLACYLPVFVGLSRVAVHRLKVPLWLTAPVVWTGLELARAHLLTGFLMGSLAHTQVGWPAVIQVSDLVGEYGVDFAIMLVAACVTSALVPPRQPIAILPAAVLLIAVTGYGHWRLNEYAAVGSAAGPSNLVRIALIQGNSLADWKADTDKQRAIMDEYVGLSRDAVAESRANGGRPIDLIVWPETMFRVPLMTFAAGLDRSTQDGQRLEELESMGPQQLSRLVEQLGTPALVGLDRVHYRTRPELGTLPEYDGYNSSALVNRDGQIVGTYDKVHLVMFGEYVPFSGWLPFLQHLSSITGSVDAGAGPVALTLDGVCYAPNICYETAIPHVIRRQVAALAATDQRPDVLVNLTNDAWYWGSSELDMHLACDVFRAVETHTPLVIAANGGLSGWIDAHGRIRAVSPRQTPDVILADVELVPMQSYYVQFGDWFAAACLLLCVALAFVGWQSRRTQLIPSQP